MIATGRADQGRVGIRRDLPALPRPDPRADASTTLLNGKAVSGRGVLKPREPDGDEDFARAPAPSAWVIEWAFLSRNTDAPKLGGAGRVGVDASIEIFMDATRCARSSPKSEDERRAGAAPQPCSASDALSQVPYVRHLTQTVRPLTMIEARRWWRLQVWPRRARALVSKTVPEVASAFSQHARSDSSGRDARAEAFEGTLLGSQNRTSRLAGALTCTTVHTEEECMVVQTQ